MLAANDVLSLRERNWLGDQGQAQIEAKFDRLVQEITLLRHKLSVAEAYIPSRDWDDYRGDASVRIA